VSLGIRYELKPIAPGDTAELYAAAEVNGAPLEAEVLASVEFSIQGPEGGTPKGPFIGEIQEDGRGYSRFKTTTEPGEYLAQATFTLTTGEVTSVLLNFAVIDPFDDTPETMEEIVANDVWFRLEDCFDSIEGGPWLKDWTRSYFDKRKMAHYINETLLDINVQMPLTEANIAEFAVPKGDGSPNELLPLLSKGVLCRVLMHLAPSYVEQPVPQGAQIVYEDRTRYTNLWKEIYKDEHEDYYTMVRLWKRGQLRLGHSAMLVMSKAGRLYYGSSMRLQNIGRGFY